MADKLPFDEKTMTLIMGLGGPEEPGQHGRKTIPAPENDAIDVITQIRDLCEDFLKVAGKESDAEETEDSGSESFEEDMEE
jgi:hypothetical protein